MWFNQLDDTDFRGRSTALIFDQLVDSIERVQD